VTDVPVVRDERPEVRRRSASQNLTELENVESTKLVDGRRICATNYFFQFLLNLLNTYNHAALN